MPDGALVPPKLLPPGVNDRRNRDFVAALDAVLAGFRVPALVVQDPMTVPSALLPAMAVERAMLDFVSPGMREDLLRRLLAAAPQIHARSGTVQGVRLALASIGVAARWTQWFQKTPKGPHGTHQVVLYVSDTVIDGHAPLDLENQRAAARIIAATKRWSQDIAIQYGVRGEAALRIGAACRRGRTVRVRAPRLGDAAFLIPSFAGAGAYALRSIRINSKAA